MVYLKLQPYRQNDFGLRGSLQLRSKYYEPFKILQIIGNMAYKLLLQDTTEIHPVFHVSQLKKHLEIMQYLCLVYLWLVQMGRSGLNLWLSPLFLLRQTVAVVMRFVIFVFNSQFTSKLLC